MTVFTTSVRGALASETSRRKTRLLQWTALGLLLFAASFWLADRLITTRVFTYVFAQTLWPCIIAYLVAAWILYRTLVVPAVEGGEVVLVATLIPFLLLPLACALLQWPYSRAALALGYLSSGFWYWLGYRLHVGHYRMRFGVLDLQTPARLAQLIGADDANAADFVELDGIASLTDALDGVIVDDEGASDDPLLRAQLVTAVKQQHLRVYSVEKVAELLTGRIALTAIDHRIVDLDDQPAYELLKRAIDVAAVLIAAPFVLPLSALVAVAIRADSPGPALFSQIRIGRNGTPFRIWKFRSMRATPLATAQFAAENDPRITRLGRALRKYRIDELPQLWNVLRGDMSLIGPRPEQQVLVDEFSAQIPCYPYRHLVRPGLSGWAQVQQGYAASADETAVKLSYDLYYVTHYSLALDMLIAYKTLRTIATGFGAR